MLNIQAQSLGHAQRNKNFDASNRRRILLNAAPLTTIYTGVQRYTRTLYQTILEQQLADVTRSCPELHA